MEGQSFEQVLDNIFNEIKMIKMDIQKIKDEIKNDEKSEKKIILNYKRCKRCESHMIPPLKITKTHYSRIIECNICGNENTYG